MSEVTFSDVAGQLFWNKNKNKNKQTNKKYDQIVIALYEANFVFTCCDKILLGQLYDTV